MICKKTKYKPNLIKTKFYPKPDREKGSMFLSLYKCNLNTLFSCIFSWWMTNTHWRRPSLSKTKIIISLSKFNLFIKYQIKQIMRKDRTKNQYCLAMQLMYLNDHAFIKTGLAEYHKKDSSPPTELQQIVPQKWETICWSSICGINLSCDILPTSFKWEHSFKCIPCITKQYAFLFYPIPPHDLIFEEQIELTQFWFYHKLIKKCYYYCFGNLPRNK